MPKVATAPDTAIPTGCARHAGGAQTSLDEGRKDEDGDQNRREERGPVIRRFKCSDGGRGAVPERSALLGRDEKAVADLATRAPDPHVFTARQARICPASLGRGPVRPPAHLSTLLLDKPRSTGSSPSLPAPPAII